MLIAFIFLSWGLWAGIKKKNESSVSIDAHVLWILGCTLEIEEGNGYSCSTAFLWLGLVSFHHSVLYISRF